MTKIAEISALYPATIHRLEPASGASQTPAWFARAADGQELFIKHDPAGTGLLEAEADGLEALTAAGPLAIPRVFAGTRHWLLMEAKAREPAGPAFWSSLAEGLVALHRCTGPIGWARDNFLGRNRQFNRWPSGPWADFFWQKRLEPQIRLLREAGIWSDQEERWLPALQANVQEVLSPVTEPPSLLHGDLWSGNILCGRGQEAILIDPAVYHGHRETDLAMTELFGGFAPTFYQRYTALWPLAPGYPERRLIYNFYHKLNHANLYGSGYIWDVKKTLRDICDLRPQPPMAENV